MEILFFALLFAVFSAVVASSKGRSGFGWFLIGLFFGPFGLIVALLPSKATPAAAAPESPAVADPGVASNSQSERSCPFCAETIKAEAIVCRFCSRDLPQVTNAPKVRWVKESERGVAHAIPVDQRGSVMQALCGYEADVMWSNDRRGSNCPECAAEVKRQGFVDELAVD